MVVVQGHPAIGPPIKSKDPLAVGFEDIVVDLLDVPHFSSSHVEGVVHDLGATQQPDYGEEGRRTEKRKEREADLLNEKVCGDFGILFPLPGDKLDQLGLWPGGQPGKGGGDGGNGHPRKVLEHGLRKRGKLKLKYFLQNKCMRFSPHRESLAIGGVSNELDGWEEQVGLDHPEFGLSLEQLKADPRPHRVPRQHKTGLRVRLMELLDSGHLVLDLGLQVMQGAVIVLAVTVPGMLHYFSPQTMQEAITQSVPSDWGQDIPSHSE